MTDRDRLIELIEQAEGLKNNDFPSVEEIADYLLANDVVNVVRCKDCKYYKTYEMSVRWNGKTKYCCRTVLLKVNPTDFCSYGELKEREGK